MTHITLNDGNKVPSIGFGTYKATEEDGVASVKFALQQGYRLIDTAAIYQNEEVVGKGIKASGIAREEIFVTTKVWRTNMGYDNTVKALNESLLKLGLDYIDLYLVHWPANTKNFGDKWKSVNAETWGAMEDLQAQGKIKSIGISNFWKEHLEPLLETAKVVPAINQLEFHPGYWQAEEVAYSQSKGIVVEAWSPLGKGKVLKEEIITTLAEKYGKTASQICLRWCIQHNTIPLPKSVTQERIIENFHVFDFELTQEEVERIDSLPQMGFSGELPNEWPDTVIVE